jgi:hypothetical protein
MIETYPHHDKIRSYDPKRHQYEIWRYNRECIIFNTIATFTNFTKIGVTPSRGWGPGGKFIHSRTGRPGKIIAASFRAKVAAGISSGSMSWAIFTTALSPPVYQSIWTAPITTGTILTDEVVSVSYSFNPAGLSKFIHASASSGPPPGNLTDVLIAIWVEYNP